MLAGIVQTVEVEGVTAYAYPAGFLDKKGAGLQVWKALFRHLVLKAGEDLAQPQTLAGEYDTVKDAYETWWKRVKAILTAKRTVDVDGKGGAAAGEKRKRGARGVR